MYCWATQRYARRADYGYWLNSNVARLRYNGGTKDGDIYSDWLPAER